MHYNTQKRRWTFLVQHAVGDKIQVTCPAAARHSGRLPAPTSNSDRAPRWFGLPAVRIPWQGASERVPAQKPAHACVDAAPTTSQDEYRVRKPGATPTRNRPEVASSRNQRKLYYIEPLAAQLSLAIYFPVRQTLVALPRSHDALWQARSYFLYGN